MMHTTAATRLLLASTYYASHLLAAL